MNRLEVDLRGELNQAWVSRGTDETKVCRRDSAIRIEELSIIEDIEELSPEFNVGLFTDARTLDERQIKVPVARTMEYVASQTSKPASAQSKGCT